MTENIVKYIIDVRHEGAGPNAALSKILYSMPDIQNIGIDTTGCITHEFSS